MRSPTRDETGLGQRGSSKDGKVAGFSACSGGSTHCTCQGSAVGWRRHSKAAP